MATSAPRNAAIQNAPAIALPRPKTLRPARPIPAGGDRAQPFVKWVGGKGRLMPQLSRLLPVGVSRMRHVEPFLGGGAFFFGQAPARARISDINPALINTYEVVRDDVETLILALRRLAKKHSKEFYYEMRTRYNRGGRRLSKLNRAALFIYMNKTCFNGLHRVNKKGEFNVPIGSYKNPRIVDEARLRAASFALSGAKLECTSFDALQEEARPGDFVYFDPPYVPLSATSNFTSYAEEGFGYEDQVRLRDLFAELDQRGCKVMLSNSSAQLVRDLYQDFDQQEVYAPRAINRNANGRGPVAELVVRNYTR